MPNYTEKLNLIKPTPDDFVDIGELNQNSDILDEQLGNHIGAGGAVHPTATTSQAGFMPANMIDRLQNIRVANANIYSALYQGELPTATPQYGTLKMYTDKSLSLHFYAGSSEKQNANIKTIMYEFNAISTNNTDKTLFVYESDNITTVFVNNVKIATQISTNQVGEIPLGNWTAGTTRNIKVVVDNRNGWGLNSTIGNLKNCEVV